MAAVAPKAPSLLDLDESTLLLVAEHLTWRELLQFETVCQRCCAVAREPALWRRLLRAEFDLAYGTRGAARWRTAFRAAHAAAAECQALSFAGAYTDCGCDGDARYSVDALFSPAPWEVYWRAPRPTAAGRNVHCLALLRPGPAGGSPAEQARRAFLLERCAAAGLLLFGAAARRGPGRSAPGQPGFSAEADLARWSRSELEALFLQLWELAQAGHALGAILFAGCSAAKRARELPRCAALAAQLRAAREAQADAGGAAPNAGAAAAALSSSADGLRIFSHPLPARAGGLQASLSRLRISRVGQFSCPLQCGAVLLGAAPPSGADDDDGAARAALAALVDDSPMLRALDDATTLEAVLDASAAGRLPRITNRGSSPAGAWAEFEPRGRALSPNAPAGALWPVAWFAFTPRAEAAARAADEDMAAAEASYGAAEPQALPDEDRFDVIDVPLRARHGGDLACVKLVGGENLMNEWGDDHSEPNIDVAAVELMGFAAAEPPAEEDCSS